MSCLQIRINNQMFEKFQCHKEQHCIPNILCLVKVSPVMLHGKEEIKQGQKKAPEAKLNIRGSVTEEKGNFLGKQRTEGLRLV